MQSIKCRQCGLVNFATAETCKRCNSNLTVQPLPTYHATPPQPIYAPQNYAPPVNFPVMQNQSIGFHCPFCRSTGGYFIRKKTSGAGCAVSIVLLFLFFPLCWVGLLMQSEERFCVTCQMKLG